MGTFRAIERGYLDGRLIEPGQTFTADDFAGSWAESLSKPEAQMARATEQALDPHPDDVNIEDLSGDALTAYAAGRGINRGRLNDKNLRAAVAAKREVNAQ